MKDTTTSLRLNDLTYIMGSNTFKRALKCSNELPFSQHMVILPKSSGGCSTKSSPFFFQNSEKFYYTGIIPFSDIKTYRLSTINKTYNALSYTRVTVWKMMINTRFFFIYLPRINQFIYSRLYKKS